MRRSLAALLAAGLLLTAACGGDDEGSGDGGDTATTEGAGEAAGAANPEAEEFCQSYMQLAGQAIESGADANAAAEQLQELEAPEEIADAWRTVVESGADAGQMTPEMQQAATELTQYVAENCTGAEMPQAPATGEGGATESTEATGTPSSAG